jgi:RNA polymerase sigma-70 factor (ECF subfamily)
MLRGEARKTVRECIGQLPENYRVVLTLRDIEEFSTQEVAGMLAITPTAVKVRLHRARQALSTLLRREFAPTAVTS